MALAFGPIDPKGRVRGSLDPKGLHEQVHEAGLLFKLHGLEWRQSTSNELVHDDALFHEQVYEVH